MAAQRDNASQLSEKHTYEHTEQLHHREVVHNGSDDDVNFEVEDSSLPKGYFYSPFFVGSMTGICLGLVAGVCGFGFIAPILGVINNDIGPVS
jgi:hypothetical protein